MPESGSANVELAHHLTEHHEGHAARHRTIEILEAILLAIVAITTAWSGYQAALWTGEQSKLYGVSSRLRVQAEGAATAANQERMYNAFTVSEWLKAEAQGNHKLATIFERRLLPEFRPAFDSWKQTDPVNNPSAPAGPQVMTQYKSARLLQSEDLNKQASQAFEEGDEARHHADGYVRITVMLATVLLLTAISQRFHTHAVRIGLGVLAALLLCLPLYHVLTLPRVH
jgi:hypothetical protein